MRFSSFIAFTAAGLAVAAPISPYSLDDKALTVEPAEVARRQVGPLTTVTGLASGGLPGVGKRQLPGLDGLLPGSEAEEKEVEPKEPKEPKEPLSVSDGNKTDAAAATEDSGVTGTGILRRQLPDLNSLLAPKEDTPAEDSAATEEAGDEDEEEVDEEDEDEDEEEDEEEKKDEKKSDKKKSEKKEEDDEKDDEKKDEKKSDKKKSSKDDEDESADEEDEDSDSEDKKADPKAAETKGGLMGTGILARQSSSKTVEETTSDAGAAADTADAAGITDTLGGLTGGLTRRQLGGALGQTTPTEESDETDAATSTVDNTLGGLTGGLSKRQLGGILGDQPATPDGDDDPNTQVSAADDGTNGENSFDAADETAKDTEEAKEEAPTEEEPAAGVLGGLGL